MALMLLRRMSLLLWHKGEILASATIVSVFGGSSAAPSVSAHSDDRVSRAQAKIVQPFSNPLHEIPRERKRGHYLADGQIRAIVL